MLSFTRLAVALALMVLGGMIPNLRPKNRSFHSLRSALSHWGSSISNNNNDEDDEDQDDENEDEDDDDGDEEDKDTEHGEDED